MNYYGGATEGLVSMGKQLTDFGMKKSFVEEERAAKAAEEAARQKYTEGRYGVELKDKQDAAALVRSQHVSDLEVAQSAKDREALAKQTQDEMKNQTEAPKREAEIKHLNAQSKALESSAGKDKNSFVREVLAASNHASMNAAKEEAAGNPEEAAKLREDAIFWNNVAKEKATGKKIIDIGAFPKKTETKDDAAATKTPTPQPAAASKPDSGIINAPTPTNINDINQEIKALSTKIENARRGPGTGGLGVADPKDVDRLKQLVEAHKQAFGK